ncbi:imidazole glycerol phosphate synthase subunit HisH [Myxococcota bacterium]|nr:imidazole glycerol phosphate synthase subunit HisH [Myxococcota bacterium]
MSARHVTVVDYGMGNLRSIARALERAGATVAVSDDARVIATADRLVIPGQGAFGQATARLAEKALAEPLAAAILAGRPVLGVCLGLQLLFETSEEAPGAEGLGVLAGAVKLLPLGPGLKRPHMGWAPVEHASDHPVLAASPSGEAFYFVHSFAAFEAPGAHVATCRHGVSFVAAVARDHLVATQFHPEKSQAAGARLLAAWLDL